MSTDEKEQPRFVVGIDLGTTNSAVNYVDTEVDDRKILTFAVPQLVAAGEVERRETLPSFHYEPASGELTDGGLDLPWDSESKYAVGVFARDHGRAVPGRLVESAKSWLCHSGVDRRANLLPWHGAPDVESLSPVDASARYLGHVRQAWDHEFPKSPLAEQDVVLTIPASFDEVARELTVTAARQAGLPKVVLIEEPQAAFYSWVYGHRDDWEDHVSPGQTILICDIGGGTSDLTLIHVRPAADDKVQFHRVAVGDHLMLGGDNLDLALAHAIEQKLKPGGKLEPRQWSVLVPTCRHVKETMLGEDPPKSYTVNLPGSGRKLIGGGIQAEITRDEVVEILVNGFLPNVKLTAKPQKRQSGFQEFGLPYAADPAITRYLASFLKTHADATEADADATNSGRPDIVLFNGGFFASPILRERLLASLTDWFNDDDDWSPQVLDNKRLDLAVARGAAYFGMVRRGVGVKIVAGLARSYYIGVEREGQPAALCLIAAGTEPSAETKAIDQQFEVLTGEPVQFPIHVSGTRLTDKPGQLIAIDEEQMSSLPPIRTVLQSKKKAEQGSVQAQIATRLTEIGTLEMWCHQVDGNKRWQLQFDVRSATETDRDAHVGTAEQSGIVDSEMIETAAGVIASVFGKKADQKPGGLPKRIGEAIEQSRDDWSPSLLRSMWASLIENEAGRKHSKNHEARWLNLLGFCLRPGFGMAADDWRVEHTYRTVRGKLIHGGPATAAEWRILCRRIAGGFTPGKQNEIASSVLPAIRQLHKQMTTGRGKGGQYASGNHEASEVWRMLGSFELLRRDLQQQIGNMILDFAPRPRFEPLLPALLWAIGRIGSRVPVYGPLNTVLPPHVVGEWIEELRGLDCTDPGVQFALMQMSRRTQDRYRDLPDSVRADVVRELDNGDAPSRFIELVERGGELDSTEAGLVFGEKLPVGLKIK
jgi:molecular chaperone DnaK (HSP70)